MTQWSNFETETVAYILNNNPQLFSSAMLYVSSSTPLAGLMYLSTSVALGYRGKHKSKKELKKVDFENVNWEELISFFQDKKRLLN